MHTTDESKYSVARHCIRSYYAILPNQNFYPLRSFHIKQSDLSEPPELYQLHMFITTRDIHNYTHVL